MDLKITSRYLIKTRKVPHSPSAALASLTSPYFFLNNPTRFSFSQRSSTVTLPAYALKTLYTILKYSPALRSSQAIDLLSWGFSTPSAQSTLSVFFIPNLAKYFNVLTVGSSVISAEPLFFNFWWLEREVFEMSGVYFFNKVDSRNLLMEYFNFFNPLIRNFPVVGYTEVFFNPSRGLLSHIPATLQI